MQENIKEIQIDEDYYSIARQTLTNDEPDQSPVIQFVASLFELSDELASLEAQIAEHELAYYGVGKNGLEDLDSQFRSLTTQFAYIQRVISDPDNLLSEYPGIEGEVSSDDATRLRTAVHSFGDIDRILTQIRETQSRVENNLTSKRNHVTTMTSLLISVISSIVATVSLLLSTHGLYSNPLSSRDKFYIALSGL